jgi:hypothetical protein
MQAFFISIASRFFHIQPATAGTKTFFTGLGYIGAAISALCYQVNAGDPNAMHYFADAVPLLMGLGTIFKRDSITKLADKIGAITK